MTNINLNSDESECPRCGSKNVQAHGRGRLIAGKSVLITCLHCGKEFKPGYKFELKRKQRQMELPFYKRESFIRAVTIILIVVILIKQC